VSRGRRKAIPFDPDGEILDGPLLRQLRRDLVKMGLEVAAALASPKDAAKPLLAVAENLKDWSSIIRDEKAWKALCANSPKE
jgi:hypothetical protein